MVKKSGTKSNIEYAGTKDKPRHYCFTAFEKPPEPLNILPLRYYVFKPELCPTTGTLHYQGYAELARPVRYKAFCTLMGMSSKCKIFDRKGTRDEARLYCLKKETGCGDPVEWGDFENGGQGARTDLVDMLEFVKTGASKKEIIENNPVLYAKYRSTILDYKFESLKESTKEFRKVTVDVIVGSPGVGKSKMTLYDENLKRKPSTFKIDFDTTTWWDGYEGEKTLIINEFYGCQQKYSKFLDILDGHQLRLPIKNSFTYANWDKVIITSNDQPDKWYTNVDCTALLDRINSVQTIEGKSQRKSIRSVDEGSGFATPDYGLDD